jgi:chemotaxis protein methyltransferase CheR
LLPTLLRDEQVAQTAINMLSVPVSEFFRDPPVWKYLREQVIPELDSFPRINVWQVGCGYGQESYSLAILLHECGLAYKARMITTDINADLLRVARRGRWPADQFAQWRANYLAAGGSACFDDYFDRQ